MILIGSSGEGPYYSDELSVCLSKGVQEGFLRREARRVGVWRSSGERGPGGSGGLEKCSSCQEFFKSDYFERRYGAKTAFFKIT